MDILDNKTNRELIQSLLAETAKAKNEIDCANRDVDCANRDIQKATSRLNFSLVLLNTLLNRKVD